MSTLHRKYKSRSSLNDRHKEQEFTADYVEESCVLFAEGEVDVVIIEPTSRHIQAFAEALKSDDIPEADLSAASPTIPGTPLRGSRIRKVSAMSDFAPIQVRVKKYTAIHV